MKDEAGTIVMLVGSVVAVLLVVAVVFALTGGLPSDIKQRVNSAVNAVELNSRNFDGQVAELKSTIEGNEAFGSAAASWTQRITQAEASMKAAKDALPGISEMLDNDDSDDASKLNAAATGASSNALAAKQEIAAVKREVDRASQFLNNRSDFVTKVRRTVEGASGSVDRIRFKVDQAITDWPGKATDLRNRMRGLNDKIAEIQAAYATVSEGNDVGAALAAINIIDQLADQIQQSRQQIPVLCDQLYTSWDKILVDMDFAESDYNIAYRHTYRVVRTTVNPGGAPTVNQKNETQNVSEHVFRQNQRNLNMVIASKPTGKYDHETSNVVQPPGYNRIPPVGQNNQYGQWQQRSDGTSFFEFYGQYALMRDMLWGSGGTTVIYADDYRGYRRSYENRQPYYGRTTGGERRFGTTGTNTRRTLGQASTRASTSHARASQAQSRVTSRVQMSRSSASSSRTLGGFSGGSRAGGGK